MHLYPDTFARMLDRDTCIYVVKAGVVYLQVKLCDPHLSALEVRFSRRGAIRIYVYLTFTYPVICIWCKRGLSFRWPQIVNGVLIVNYQQ